MPNSAPQSRVAFASMASNTGCSSPGELEITCSISEVAVCCSSASARCARASASSRVRTSSCSSSSAKALRPRPTRVPAFVPIERSWRPWVRSFVPLRDKVTSSAQSLVPSGWEVPQPQGWRPSILTQPHRELAPPSSFDHLVGALLHRYRNGQAERLGGLEVDDQLELGRRLHRQIAWLLALQDTIDI